MPNGIKDRKCLKLRLKQNNTVKNDLNLAKFAYNLEKSLYI